MDHERWRQIEDLYHAAQSLPAGARAQFLASECRGDESLRSEVESLIAQPDPSWTAVDVGGKGPDKGIIGKRLGHYEVQSLLGAGGMGRVYGRATQGSGVTSRSSCCRPRGRATPIVWHASTRSARPGLAQSPEHRHDSWGRGRRRDPSPDPRTHRGRHSTERIAPVRCRCPMLWPSSGR